MKMATTGYENVRLELLTEQRVKESIVPEHVFYCPSMDLIAVASSDGQVTIFRLHGQEVYKTTEKNDSLKVRGLAWKPNGNFCCQTPVFVHINNVLTGQLLAIAWSDGWVRLIGAESTKVVHRIPAGGDSSISCIGWTSNLTQPMNGRIIPSGVTSWRDLMNSIDSRDDTVYESDLPGKLSHIDIETSLPRLSTLASSGTA